MSELSVWQNDERVGIWTRGRSGHHRFNYDRTWLDSPRARPLSLSMPISANRTAEGAAVGNFFDNLLPDDESIRRRLQTRFRTKSTEAFDLLQAIGRDCVGAVQILPADQAPSNVTSLNYDALSEIDVEHVLQNVTAFSGLGASDDENDFRISIAGAQEKTALLKIGTQWCRPKGSTPTTHILKLPLGHVGGNQLDLSHSVENEWLCSRILKELGLAVANTEIAVFGSQKVLSVERFDRRWMAEDTWIARLPQEDFCQASGIRSSHKYESDGGPGIHDCLKILAGGDDFQADGMTFLLAQLAFWLLAATDGHAKNFSIFLLPGGRYRMTPLYDVLSAWPVIGKGSKHIPWQKAKLAMAVRAKNVHYKISELHARHWLQLAEKSGVVDAEDAMMALVEKTENALTAIESALPRDFPVTVADAIFAGTRSQISAFRAEISTD